MVHGWTAVLGMVVVARFSLPSKATCSPSNAPTVSRPASVSLTATQERSVPLLSVSASLAATLRSMWLPVPEDADTPPHRMKPEHFDEVVDFCDLVFAGNGGGERHHHHPSWMRPPFILH